MDTLTNVNVKYHSYPTKSDLVSAIYVIPWDNEIQGSLCGKACNDSVPHPV